MRRNASGSAREVLLGAGQQALRARGASTDGRARRGWARSRGSAPRPAGGELLARRRERRPGRRSARRRRSRARSRASRSRPRRAGRAARRGWRRRAPGRPARSAGPRGCAARRPSARPRRRAARRARPTRRRATSSERERAAARAAEPLEPDRGVDLVDRRAARQAHDAADQSATPAVAPAARAAARPAGTAAPRSRSSRSDGWRRCRRRCRRGSTRGTAAGRASADRPGTSRCRRTPGGARRSSLGERRRQAPADLRGDLEQVHLAPRAGRALDLEPVAVVAVQLAAARAGSRGSSGTRPGRASSSCRRTCRCPTRPAGSGPRSSWPPQSNTHGLVEVAARDRADPVRAEELVLVEHDGEDPPQPRLVDQRERAAGPRGSGRAGARAPARRRRSARRTSCDALDELGVCGRARRRRTRSPRTAAAGRRASAP